ncbi:MAG: tRNA (adenosine(37)-N6)-threonylcarbamoyltransferase complex ATPase subunit type 1 TsaE [Candidatus Omnitrophota bacterium]
MDIITNSPYETKRLGVRLGRLLAANAVVALAGTLGAGKTVLVKGIARGLGIAENKILSPTFVLIREHAGKRYDLFHFDFYRIEAVSLREVLELEEYFTRGGICVIEWAEKITSLLPRNYLLIKIDILSANERRLRFRPRGKGYRELVEKI